MQYQICYTEQWYKRKYNKRGMPMSQNSLQNDLIVLYENQRKVRGFQKKTYQSDMGILKEENQTLLECVKETIENLKNVCRKLRGMFRNMHRICSLRLIPSEKRSGSY